MPRFYWDFGKAKQYLAKEETPWTPAVNIIYALTVSLDMLMKEGLPNIFARHAKIAKICRDGAKAMGLKLVAQMKNMLPIPSPRSICRPASITKP